MTAASCDMSLDPDSFRAIAELAYRESGLTLVEEKSSMIQSRLRPRLRVLGLNNFAQYSDFVGSDAGTDERKQLISALTTNVTHFFRENHHFETLGTVIDARMEDLRNGARMRVWSAGCSNGQEAYSAAMTLLERCPQAAKYDLRILATDIDPQVINFARRGSYAARLMEGVSEPLRKRYFNSNSHGLETQFTAKPELKNLIHFNELNLLAPWPMRGSFDVIFCRNVVIYFDLATQTVLWPRFHKALRPDGHLFLGHSERIAAPEALGFRTDGPTSYRPLPS